MQNSTFTLPTPVLKLHKRKQLVHFNPSSATLIKILVHCFPHTVKEIDVHLDDGIHGTYKIQTLEYSIS